MRVLPQEVTAPSQRTPAPPTIAELLDSIPSLQQAVAADPNDANLRLRLGTALFSLGRFDSALVELREAVRLDSSIVDNWIALGRVSFYAGLPQCTLIARDHIGGVDSTGSHQGARNKLNRRAVILHLISQLNEGINGLLLGFGSFHNKVLIIKTRV